MRLHTRPLLAFLSCLLTGAARAEPPPPADINVVKSWGELFDTEPIDIGGQKVRVGIEGDSFAAGGGVLVYCLADGPPADRNGSDFETVGPVSVRVTRGCPEMKRARHQREMTRHRRMAGPRLYVGVVAAGSGGPLSVTVRRDGAGDDEPPLASREVKVAEEPYHGWTRLVPARPPRAADAGAGDAERVRVVVRSDMICVPHRDGFNPFAFDGTDGDRRVRRERADALPKLIPRDANPGLRLVFDGTSATVESDVPFYSARPEEGLLVRWTVNGKPVIPPRAAAQVQAMQQLQRQLNVGPRTLRLRLEWDPADIGARRGDTVGAQLLFSPGGVRPLPPPERMWQYPIQAGGDTDYVSRMTNRAEFVVP